MYFIKTPYLIKKMMPNRIWNKSRAEKKIYLTFDDGPNEMATPFVLNILEEYNAKATFFCIGKNVVQYPSLFEQIIDQGHSIGNHTHNHLNGFKTENSTYIENILEAEKYIDSKLFRPPYGRCSNFQAKVIGEKIGFKIIMWDILSGDFDVTITPEQCANNVLLNTTNGSIVVFHDSEKAFANLKIALPKTLEFFNNKGFEFCKL